MQSNVFLYVPMNGSQPIIHMGMYALGNTSMYSRPTSVFDVYLMIYKHVSGIQNMTCVRNKQRTLLRYLIHKSTHALETMLMQVCTNIPESKK